MKFFSSPPLTDIIPPSDGNELICYCLEVKKETVLEAIRNGAQTLQDIKRTTKACTGNQCREKNPTGKCCAPALRKLLQEYG